MGCLRVLYIGIIKICPICKYFKIYLNEPIKSDLMEGKILRVIEHYPQRILKRSISDEATEDNFTFLVLNTIDKIMIEAHQTLPLKLAFDDLNRGSKTS